MMSIRFSEIEQTLLDIWILYIVCETIMMKRESEFGLEHQIGEFTPNPKRLFSNLVSRPKLNLLRTEKISFAVLCILMNCQQKSILHPTITNWCAMNQNVSINVSLVLWKSFCGRLGDNRKYLGKHQNGK